jgi:uncharacterized membrane-anchored protein
MMGTFRVRFFLLVAFQIVLMAGLIGYKQVTLITGQRVLLETVPVDPRDLFRGDYVILNYPFSTLESWQRREPGDAAYPPSLKDLRKGDGVYVKLKKSGRFWDAESFSKARPEEGELFIRGTLVSAPSPPPAQIAVRASYGIESLFVPEGKGRDLEAVQREPGGKLIVEAAVDRHGKAAIRSVILEGKDGRRVLPGTF